MGQRGSKPRGFEVDPQVVGWGYGCLVALSAITGAAILLFLIALVLQPPRWVQVLLGIGLTAGGALLAWLIASAVARSRSDSADRRLGSVDNPNSPSP